MIIEDIANLIERESKRITGKRVAKLFNKERKWVTNTKCGCSVKLDTDFVAGLDALGYELVLQRKERR